MFSKRRVVGWFDHRAVRRLVIVPLVLLSAFLAIALSPLLVLVSLAWDLAQRPRRLRRLRLTAMIATALIIEVVGMLISLIVWIITGFGLLGSERWRWHMHRWYMGRYTAAMLTAITRVLGTHVIWREHADLSSGPVVLVARHTSFFDALIPATLLCRRNRLLAHHVVTHGLRYAPCIDIVGHRFPNRFIKRSPGEGSSELIRITQIGAQLDERSAAIIFPEGTFRNPERFERVVRRLGRREPELAAEARELKHVLPPRANGTFALLEGAPTADLVVCTNTGFEPFGSIKDIVTAPVAERAVIVETWRISRADIPTDADTFARWLFDRFVDIDEWVESQQPDQRALAHSL